MRISVALRKEAARLGINDEQLKRSISIMRESGVPPYLCSHHFADGVCIYCGALEAALAS